MRMQEKDDYVAGAKLLPMIAEDIESPLSPQRRADCVLEATDYLAEADGRASIALNRATKAIRAAEKELGFGGPLHARASGEFVLELLRVLKQFQAQMRAEKRGK